MTKLDSLLNRIHVGDCLDIMADMPSESVDIIVTSPPYNIASGRKHGGLWDAKIMADGYNGYGDNLPYPEYVEWQRMCITAMLRLLKNTGVLFYNHKYRIQKGLLNDRTDITSGFPVRQIIIWHRSAGINFNRSYFLPTYEVVYMIPKPGFRLLPKANGLTDVWKITPDSRNPHPAPFPIELPRRCISAAPGDVVLDPFMGSGTTAVAAIQEGRNWIGVDRSQEYADMAERRIVEYIEVDDNE